MRELLKSGHIIAAAVGRGGVARMDLDGLGPGWDKDKVAVRLFEKDSAEDCDGTHYETLDRQPGLALRIRAAHHVLQVFCKRTKGSG